MIQKRVSKLTGAISYMVRLRRPVGDRSGKKFIFETFPTKVKAREWEADQLSAMKRGTFVEPSEVPLRDYLMGWLNGPVAGQVRPRTLEGYCRLLKRYVLDHPLGALPLGRVTTQDLEGLYTELRARGLSPRSVAMVHGVLRPALGKAARDQMILRNPATGAQLPRQERREMHALDREQVSIMLATSEALGSRWHALWHVLVNGGLRPSEALGLRWQDVRTERVHVRNALVVTRDGWQLTEPKTKGSGRTVKLPAATMEALGWHRTQQEAEKLTAGTAYTDHGLVFASQTGSPLDLKNIAARHFKPLLKAFYQLPDIRLYDLRHTHASILLALGEQPHVVAKRLGHASPMMTLNVYAHVLSGQHDDTVAKLEAYMEMQRA